MNKHEYDLGYSSLETYYQAKVNSARYDLWWDKMKSLPARAFNKAIDRWIEESRFFPTLGQIKRMAYEFRTPEEIRGSRDQVNNVSESEIALGKDLFPLFIGYVNGDTSREEWDGQMIYFAEKHGHGEAMKRSIHEHHR